MADQELFNGTNKTTIADDENLAFEKPGQVGSLNITWANFKTFLATLFVSLSGNQTIAGVKTFAGSPIVPNPTTNLQAANLGTLLKMVGVYPVDGSPLEFSDSDLIDGVLNINHGLSAENLTIILTDSNGIQQNNKPIIKEIDSNNLQLIFSSTLSGTWKVKIKV